MNPNQTQLDPQVLNMAKAIRQVESQGNFQAKGGSGEYGGYQFTPDTWNAASQKYLGQKVDLFNATPEQQNEVAYKQISEWKNQGYNVGQVASMWNAGKGKPNAYLEGNSGVNSQGVSYDTAGYAKKVADAYNQIKQSSPQISMPGSIPGANASDDSQPQSGPSVSGFIGNVAKSAGNVLGGLDQAVMHPVKTAESVLGTIGGAIEKPFGIDNEDTKMFDNTVQYFKNRYGGDSLQHVISNIGKSAYNDPVGVALDVSTLLDGVGGALSAVSKTSKIAELGDVANQLRNVSQSINPIGVGAKVGGKAISTATEVGKFGVSKLIGLNKAEDVTNIINNYDKFSKEQRSAISGGSLADEVFKAGEALNNTVEENGNARRILLSQNEGKMIPVPENWIQDVLEKGTTAPLEDGSKAIPFKIGLEPVYPKTEPGVIQMEPSAPIGYKVVADGKSFTRQPGDIAAIQHFVDTWGGKTELTPEEFLNMRSDLAKMGKFGKEIGKNDGAELISRALRADANKVMRGQIRGLKEADLRDAPAIREWNQFKKDFLKPSDTGSGYVFKDGAINKIRNATGKGKDFLLERLEKSSPGITQKIELLKTVESIESAYNMKVGTYAKDMLGVGAVLHGNVPGIIAAIVSHPGIAVPLLRGLGWTKAQIAPVLQFLRTYINSGTLRYPTEAGVVTNDAESQGKPTLK